MFFSFSYHRSTFRWLWGILLWVVRPQFSYEIYFLSKHMKYFSSLLFGCVCMFILVRTFCLQIEISEKFILNIKHSNDSERTQLTTILCA